VRFTVESQGARARAVAFGTGGRLPLPAGHEQDGRLRATFTLEVNEWNGVSEPRLVLRRVQAASSPEGEPVRALDMRGRSPAGEPDGRPPAGVAGGLQAGPGAREDPAELVLFASP
jgi:single-stranded-DNA-specific exonuclease